jgi:hypothetical protein
MNRLRSVLSLMLVAVLFAGIDVTLSSAQVSADTAASQSMKFMALSESGKILQDLQVGDSRAIIAKCAPQLDYHDKGKISRPALRSEIEKYFTRWTNRRYTHAETTLVEYNSDAGIYRVQVDFDWSVSDLKNSRSGRSRIELVWSGTTDDNLSVIIWKEHRLQ